MRFYCAHCDMCEFSRHEHINDLRHLAANDELVYFCTWLIVTIAIDYDFWHENCVHVRYVECGSIFIFISDNNFSVLFVFFYSIGLAVIYKFFSRGTCILFSFISSNVLILIKNIFLSLCYFLL